MVWLIRLYPGFWVGVATGLAGVSDMAAGRSIPVTVGNTEVLVETVAVAPPVGTEPTAGRAQRTLESAAEAFDHAQQVIVNVATSTAEMIEKAAARAARPDHVEIEFGLSFSATGGIVMVAGATAGATLRVLLSYDAKLAPAPGPAAGGGQPAAPGPAES
jgi:NTP-dependent ternary system trypsin peptidase co-occuring protein